MSIQEKIQKLLSLGMNTGRELNKYGNTPLADYLTLSLKDKSLVIPDFLSFSLFQQALTNFLSDQAIYTKEQSQRFAEQISVAPFIQRVDHGELFLDKGTFLNNLFYQIAARENNIPFLGICLGMQMAVVEFARNVLGLADANSVEFNEKTTAPVIHIMEEQKGIDKKGGTMRLGAYECKIKEGSVANKVYEKLQISERHRHRFEYNNYYKQKFEDIIFQIENENIKYVFNFNMRKQ